MCGIAGIIYRGRTGDVGRDMTRMLQSMRHRGADSTGYALYGEPSDLMVMRFSSPTPPSTATSTSASASSAIVVRSKRGSPSSARRSTGSRASRSTPTGRRSVTRAS